jgi:hypothetical protein
MIPTLAIFNTLSLPKGGVFQGHFDEISTFHTSRFVRLFPNESCGKCILDFLVFDMQGGGGRISDRMRSI